VLNKALVRLPRKRAHAFLDKPPNFPTIGMWSLGAVDDDESQLDVGADGDEPRACCMRRRFRREQREQRRQQQLERHLIEQRE
jgi:hypothetical protein